MADITIHMEFFGAFRKFGKSLDFCVPVGSTIALVRKVLQEKLNGDRLVMDSALANENSILRDNDILNSDTELSILPPVCGG